MALAAAALVLIFRSRAWAATLAEAGLLVLGVYGWVIAAFWPAVPGHAYLFSDLQPPAPAPLWSDALEGSILLALGLWLAPRVMRHHLVGPVDPELAARARQLTQRVQTLTKTRHDAVDTAAAELRRIERDLHDGAQARLVALGMSLRAAERLFPTSPEAALALVAEAKESSSLALTELRDLALMAEGRSNVAIAQRLFITEKAVSKHAAGIFAKLDLVPSDDDNRRVLAVLAYLGS